MKDSSFRGRLCDLHAYEYFIHHHLQFIAVSYICIGILPLIFSAHWSPMCSFLYSAWGNVMLGEIAWCLLLRDWYLKELEFSFIAVTRAISRNSSDVPSGIVQTSVMWRDPRSFSQILEGLCGSRDLSSLKHGGQARLLNITPAPCALAASWHLSQGIQVERQAADATRRPNWAPSWAFLRRGLCREHVCLSGSVHHLHGTAFWVI